MDFVQRRRTEAQALAADRQGAQQQSRSRDAVRPRHAGIFEALHRLDMEISQVEREELIGWLRGEYHEELADLLLGFVAVCQLGPPYVDHRLDLVGSIVDHFAPADVMPEPYARARMLVRTGGYAFVEVYGSGLLRPVLPDGTVVL